MIPLREHFAFFLSFCAYDSSRELLTAWILLSAVPEEALFKGAIARVSFLSNS